MNIRFELHFDQKYLGSFDTYALARDAMNERATWEKVAAVSSGADSVEIFICRTPGGIFNYAYASITIISN
jgi:hypothetical protein